MIEFLPVSEGNVIAVRMSGKLTVEEYQEFLPRLETQIKRYGKISVLVELDDFIGWELAAAKEDFMFAMKHDEDIEKFAFVGNKLWQRWIALMAQPFVSSEVRYFIHDDMHEAWDWVRDKQKPEIDTSAEKKVLTVNDVIEDVAVAPYQRILVAVDFSPHSVYAAKRAAELAQYYQAELTLLHMVEQASIYDTYYDPIDMNLMIEDLPAFESKNIAEHNAKVRRLGQKRLQNMVEKLELGDVAKEVLGGNAASGIVTYAEAQQTDLIVMGTHGRRGVSRILGSVARSVQSSARCEVLIVPLPEQA